MSIFKNNFVVGVTAALVASVVAPMLIPVIKRSSRPLAKSLVKGGVFLYEKSREAVASAGEMVEDVVAEVRSEAMEKQAAAMVDAPAGYAMAAESAPQAYSSGNGSRGTGNGAASPQVERGGPT